jgi:putative transposase
VAIKKSWHCAYEIHYHIVFPVKYRRTLLRPEIEQSLVEIANEIQERYEIEFEEMGADRDHIHLLCSAHPKISIDAIVRIFKSVTARELFRTYPDIKRKLWGGEFWSDGYYAATVGQRNNWGTVYRYVKNQGQKTETTLRRFAQPKLPDV